MEQQSIKREKRVAFLTLGCKVNSYETDAMEQLFISEEYDVVPFSHQADIYVVNTCTVTNMADRKSRQMLHKAKKQNPNAIIVAAGCYVQAAKEQLEQDEAIDIVIGNNQKNKIVELVEGYFKDREKRKAVIEIEKEKEYESLSIQSAGERTRAYIKIQDGCNQFCSYCIIPYARGRVRSRKEEEIIKEIKELAKKGYQEVVLTGIHLSSYGVDEENKDFVKLEGKPILSLLEQIEKIEGIERVRLGSLEPRIISEAFAHKLSSLSKVCPHFHLSLQSGCDTTLKRMNRKYSTKEYKSKCIILRKYFENPAITTDVIVGFPGETQEEFLITKKFLEEIGFSQMHVFKYSVRKGTRAEKMTNQVSDQEKAKRSDIILEVERKLRADYQSSFFKGEEKVLFEEEVTINQEKYWVGHNERYFKFALPCVSEKNKILNHIITVKTEDKVLKDNILCKLQ